MNLPAAIQDQFAQPQGLIVGKDARKLLIQDLVIHAREEVFDIAFQHIRVLRAEFLGAINCGVRAFSLAAGIGVMDEAAVEERLDHTAQGMMYDTVTEWRGGDQTRLGIEDLKVTVLSWLVGFLL